MAPLRGRSLADGQRSRAQMVTTYRCLDHEFSVRAERADDEAAVMAALSPFAVTDVDDPATTYELCTVDGQHWLYVDQTPVRVSHDPGEPLDLLFWYIGENIVRDESSRLLLHSGAVVVPDGRALLLPGPSGSGKTLTTLGLVGAGMQYLSDEFGVVDPESGLVVPFPRPLALKHGARRLLPYLDALGVSTPTDPRTTLHVPVERLGGSAAAGDVEPAWVVFPTYVEGAATVLTALSAAQTCSALLQCTFRLREHPHQALDVMAGLARRTRGFRLTVGDLGEAVELLSRLTSCSPSRERVRIPAGDHATLPTGRSSGP